MSDDLVVKFGAETSGLQSGVDVAKRAIREISPVSTEATRALEMLAGFMTAATIAAAAMAAAVGAAALAVGGITASATALGEETRKIAGDFDQTNEAVGRMGAVAKVAGVETKKLAEALQELAKGIKDEDEDTANALKAVGLNADALKGKDMPGMLRVLAEAFSNTAESANKLAAAKALLGEEAEKLLPVLNRGVDAYDRTQDMARRAGAELQYGMGVALAETSNVIRDTKENATELGMSFQGLALAIYDRLKPAIDGFLMVIRDVVGAMASVVQWLTNAITQGGLLAFSIEAIGFAFKVVVSAIAVAIAAFEILFRSAVNIATQVANVFVGLAEVIIAVFKDALAAAGAFFSGLLTAGIETAKGVGQVFVNLGQVISRGIKGDFAGASEAFGQIGADASASAAKIASAFSGMGEMANTRAALGKMTNAMAAEAQDFSATSLAIAARTKAQLETLWGNGGDRNPWVKPKNAARDPSNDNEAGSKGKRNNDAARAAMLEVDQEIAALQAGLARKIAIYEQDFKQKKISESQKFALIQQATEEEYQAELALLKKKAEIDGLRPQQKQQVLNQIAALENKHRIDMLKLDYAAINASQNAWKGYLDTISGAINGQIRGLLAGTTSLAQAAKNIAADLIVTWVQAGVKMAANWAAMQLGLTTATTTGAATRAAAEVGATAAAETGKTAAVAAGVTARTGLESAGMMASITTTISAAFTQIAAWAGSVIAGVTAFLAPLFGPAALPVALGVGAATVAAGVAMVNSFDVGSYRIQGDQLAMIHSGEMVIPQRGGVADEFRTFMGNGGFSGLVQNNSQSNRGDTHLHVHAVDAASVERLFNQNGRALAKVVQSQVQLNPSLRA